jgi:precorrin-6B methylase 1
MSRHLTSKAISGDSPEVAKLKRNLGMHVAPKPSALNAMAAIHANAVRQESERALIERREALVKNMTEGELQLLAIFGWKDGEGEVAKPVNHKQAREAIALPMRDELTGETLEEMIENDLNDAIDFIESRD